MNGVRDPGAEPTPICWAMAKPEGQRGTHNTGVRSHKKWRTDLDYMEAEGGGYSQTYMNM